MRANPGRSLCDAERTGAVAVGQAGPVPVAPGSRQLALGTTSPLSGFGDLELRCEDCYSVLLAGLCAASPAGLRGALEDGRDGVDVVEVPGGHVHHQVVGLIVGQGQPAAVESVERDDRGERRLLPSMSAWFRTMECSSAAALASRSA